MWDESVSDRGNACTVVRWGHMRHVQGIGEAGAAAACEGKHMVEEGVGEEAPSQHMGL